MHGSFSWACIHLKCTPYFSGNALSWLELLKLLTGLHCKRHPQVIRLIKTCTVWEKISIRVVVLVLIFFFFFQDDYEVIPVSRIGQAFQEQNDWLESLHGQTGLVKFAYRDEWTGLSFGASKTDFLRVQKWLVWLGCTRQNWSEFLQKLTEFVRNLWGLNNDG